MTPIQTGLLPTPADLKTFPTQETLEDGGVLLLFSLGFGTEDFVAAARSVPEEATVLLADCYGVLGTEWETDRNREFMEQGRGREYGGVGGRGGRGVVAVALAGAAVEGASAGGPYLVVAAHGRPHPEAGFCFGGVAKATWRWDREAGRFTATDGFALSLPQAWRIGLTVCDGEIDAALERLCDTCPEGHRPGAVALFPCYMRGINHYGRDDVEPEAVARAVPGVPIFGMFCHGELGPSRETGFDPAPGTACRRHSMVTVAALLCPPA